MAVTTEGWDRRDPKLAVAAADSARWHRIKGFAPTSTVAWSPDSARFAFSELRRTAWRFISLRANGTAARKLTNGDPVGMAQWAPDGRRILIVAGTRDGRSMRDLKIVPADGGRPRRVTRVATGVAITSVSWRR